MIVASLSMRARFFSAAIAAALLAGCAGASSGYSGVSPAMPATHDGLISFASDGPQLQTLDVPLSEFPMAIGTLVTGIRGKFISGFENNLNGSQIGFIYDRNAGTWTKLKKPGATATSPYGPTLTSTGYRVVGSYENQGETGTQGFIYDSTTKKYQTVDAPTNLCAPKACNFTIFHSNFGKTDFQAVGNYDAVKSTSTSGTSDTYPQSGHAFIYDSKAGTFTTLQIAGAISSTAYGIWVDGKTTAIAGGYNDKKGTHAYVRSLDGSKMLSYDWPKSAITHFEGITGAGGAGNYNVIGDYTDAKNKQLVYGFFLPIRNWTAGTATVIGPVSANSVYQNTVIGVYVGAGLQNGYITKIAP